MLRIVLLTVGATIVLVLLWRLGPVEISHAVGRIGWDFVLVVLLACANHLTCAGALCACVFRPGVLRYRDAVAIRFSGEAVRSLTFTGPILAEPTKAWLLEERGLTLREGFGATFAEYLIDAFVTAAIAITGVL